MKRPGLTADFRLSDPWEGDDDDDDEDDEDDEDEEEEGM